MNSLKKKVIRKLKELGLYELAHKVYANRHLIRIYCWNAGFRLAGSGDGISIPPTSLIYLVTTGKSVCQFLYGGKLSHESILYTLRINGYDVHEFDDILDFGCGCGRVIRYWRSVEGPRLYGTDYNPDLIAWCEKHLGDIARFYVNQLMPPLSFGDGKFDFIYANSIFTHLSDDLQHVWMREMYRLLKPNGLLLITLHGDSRLHQLAPSEQERYLADQLVVKQVEAAGKNECSAYHPRKYVYEILANGFEVVDFIEVGARDADQDIFLLKKGFA